MKHFFLLGSFASLLLASTANAADWYVSPTGTATSSSCCATRSDPCDIESAASGAVAGDTVILMDGVYMRPLYVRNSGTPEAWITFKADECATPILEGTGPGPQADDQSTGVGSQEAEYVRFEGIVARGWNIGFGNGWAGGVQSEDVSNGHWEIEHCISYSNGRTGFTFFSAEGFVLKNSIAAHNGSSELHAWSSGVTLFEATGDANRVEGTISFENTDFQRHTDGNGFIVDELSNGVTFVNNIAFRNGGSCLRLTDSSGTTFINNTCYQNSQLGALATNPTNPGEIYFTNAGITHENVNFMNNVIVGTGLSPAGPEAVVNVPPSGWSNNVVTTGSSTFFTDPTGATPNFVPAAGAMELIGKATSGNGAPTNDVGFDPKCLVKRTPIMVGEVAAANWWEFDVDIDYVKSIGGVKACFNATARPSAPDIGAYNAGPITTVTPGSCQPPDPPMGGTSGTGACVGGVGGMGGGTVGAGSGGVISTGGVGGTTAAGATNGGSAGTPNARGGSTASGGGSSAGQPGSGTGGATSTGGGTHAAGTGGSDSRLGPANEALGCGCRLAPRADRRQSLAALGLLGFGVFGLQRRRRRR